CHPLCQHCVANLHDTGSVCLKCQHARHLLLGDHCVADCPPGHYAERGTCKRCHSFCRSCQNGGPFSCSSCDTGLVLTHLGTCSTACFPGHYMDDNQTCQPCNMHCRSCDSQGSCTSCRDPSKVLLFGECQYETCAPQYYLDISTKTCRECDWSCNACSGPLRTDCLQCMDGYVLQDGVCMEQCSPEYYRDSGFCKRCDSHCLQCQGPHECTRCEEPFLLFQTQCVQECGKGYFADHAKHKCIDKMYTPSLHVNGSLTLGIGSMKPLDFSLLNIQHQDGRVEDLLFHIVSTPTNGQLLLSRNGKEVQLEKAGHFSWKDVNDKKVRFVHTREKLRKGYFSLKISDQQFFSEPQMISIEAFSTQAPYVLRNEVLHISKGEKAAITTQLLDIRDDDNPQDVVMNVLDPPRHGQLLQTLPAPAAPIYEFHLDELSRGLLLYAHDGSDSTSDVVVLQANDGHSFLNILFHVKNVPKNDGALRLVTNSMVWVPEGGMLKITNRILQAQAPGVRAEDIVYKITHDNPEFGEVVFLMNLPADSPASPAEEGQHLPDGRMATPTSTFTQQDINDGIVWYRHLGAPTQSDSFHFQARENGLTAIQPHSLSFVNSESPRGKIIYNITVPLHPNQGLPESVKFYFTVSDGQHLSPEMALTIHLLHSDRQPPAFQIRAPLLEVRPGGRTSLGLQLVGRDAQMVPEELFFQLQKPPQHGSLLKSTAESLEPMAAGDTFTYDEVERNTLQYIHDGSSAWEDSMELSVTDGLTVTTAEVRVEVSPSEKRGPRLAPGSSLSMTVASQRTAAITRSNLAYVDDSSPDSEIWIQLRSLPMYGVLLKTSGSDVEELSEDFNVTMEDINRKSIKYSAAFETEEHLVMDSFHFSVSDMDHNRVDNQVFTITITPAKSPPHIIAFADLITVDEGGRTPLSLHHFFATDDHDNLRGDAVIKLSALPKYGCIENTGTGHLLRRPTASDPLENGTVLDQGSSFTYQDVLAGLVGFLPADNGMAVDEFRFSLTDGLHVDMGRMEVYIELPTSDTPHLVINRGLQVSAGSVARITEQHLKVTDAESDDRQVLYIMKEDPGAGRLQMAKPDSLEQISVKGPIRSFTQADISQGQIEYSHGLGEPGGSFAFKFDVVDGEGNTLADQSFSIGVLEAESPPVITTNKGLVLDENSVKKITTAQLSATDQDSEPAELTYRITAQPQLGHLEYMASPGIQISSFTQDDLIAQSVQYVHSSRTVKHSDAFSFVLSDGVHEVTQTFHITIHPVDDSLPLVQNRGMRVQEGVRKTITEFELKAVDADTEAQSITFTIVQPPRHGTLERTARGQPFQLTSSFTMEDIYQNRVSYSHDGSNSLKDRFAFTVSDGTNPFFITEEGGKEIMTAAPQQFHVDIIPVDDGTPRIVTNLGLQWLEYMDGKISLCVTEYSMFILINFGIFSDSPKATNLITKKELLTVDPDTEDAQLVYEITMGPRHGYVENKLQPGRAASAFTQEDVNLGLIRYVLHEEKIQKVMDSFQFRVKDSKPNVVNDNIFHIQWSLISFKYT
ncbi:hypothetical protein STEG23_036151, partial [Scotinomys teguina]